MLTADLHLIHIILHSFFISIETSLPARVAILATTMLTLMNKAANAREVERIEKNFEAKLRAR